MRPDILVVGQGLAGTLLAWELECAGFSFAIADTGHAEAASRAGAGIINPITGRRLVKSWRIDTLLPLARSTYRAMASAWGVPLWRELRIRRFFADERERRIFAEKKSDVAARETDSGWGAYAGMADDAGFWIEGGARVDLDRLLTTARARWRSQGRLQEQQVDATVEATRHGLVVDCTGANGAQSGQCACVPWEFSKGEVLEIAVDGLEHDVGLNRRQWILPLAAGAAWVGATHEPGVLDRRPSDAARAVLAASARELLRRDFAITSQRAGLRVNLPDKRPMVGRHPERSSLGMVNGLGAKGTLLAPLLARQWVEHLRTGASFDPELDVARFLPRKRS